MNNTKKGIPRLLKIAGEGKGLLILSAALSAFSAVCMLLPYIAVYFILAELLKNASSLALIDTANLFRWGIFALAALIGGVITIYGSGLASHTAAYQILYNLRIQLAGHIGKLPLGYLSGTSAGIIKKNFDQNVEKIETFVAHQLPDMISVLVTSIVIVILMLFLHPMLTIAALMPLIIGFSIQMKKRSGKAAQESAKSYYDALEKISTSTIQYVKGIPVVKVFGRTVHSFRQFYDDMISYRDYCVQYTDHFQNTYIAAKVLLNSTLLLILPVGIILLAGNYDLSLTQTLVFFILLAPAMASPMSRFMGFASALGDISEGVSRIDNIFEQKVLEESNSPQKPSSYEVEFDQVSFSYDTEEVSAKTEALTDVSFQAPQGKITALVGPSGSGKSTIANLIPRFWDIKQGNIRIGGIDIRDIGTRDLMDMVSFVFQDNFLFHDTLFENIRMGRVAASKKEVYAAAQTAQCHEFISRLEKGYDTVVGEGGTHLSGGEEQRVCVARAILKNTPILVLDEATAFADPENEYHMQLALRELIKNKTIIMIAHRLTTIQDADQIIVMQDGKIAEQGKHKILLQQRGLYKKLWDAYTSASDWGLGERSELL